MQVAFPRRSFDLHATMLPSYILVGEVVSWQQSFERDRTYCLAASSATTAAAYCNSLFERVITP